MSSSSSSKRSSGSESFSESESKRAPVQQCDECDVNSGSLVMCALRDCGQCICPDCQRSCAGCSETFCVYHVRECCSDDCGKEICEDCIQTEAVAKCDNCDEMFCTNTCSKLCLVCKQMCTCLNCFPVHNYYREKKWYSCWTLRGQQRVVYLSASLGVPVDLVNAILVPLPEKPEVMWKKGGHPYRPPK